MKQSEIIIEEPIVAIEAARVESKFSWKTKHTLILAAAILVAGTLVFLSFDSALIYGKSVLESLSPNFYLFVLAGFIAQMIDGALGMAYGVSASTFLLSFGVPPAAASASIHTSEIFTSGVSGLMHLKFGNVNKKLFKTLLLPGVIGAALGAYVLSSLEEYNYILKPIIAVYTLYLGVLIIVKAVKGRNRKVKTKTIPPLATFGGFMDSIGGGGWGPIVSSTLIAGGRHPRYTVGSVNLAEFFVALASSLTFFAIIGLSHIQIIVGLVLGGVIAAPIAANLSKKLPVKTMMIMVGIVVILVSIRIIFLAVTKLI
jgi:uncharacterized protein